VVALGYLDYAFPYALGLGLPGGDYVTQ
jgi:hypothetical protein